MNGSRLLTGAIATRWPEAVVIAGWLAALVERGEEVFCGGETGDPDGTWPFTLAVGLQ